MRPSRFIRLLCLVVICVASSAHAAENAKTADAPAIVSVTKIWDDGKHNAFTDLLRFNNQWYCTFRESDAHVGGEGKVRSLDVDGWQSLDVACPAHGSRH